MDLDQLADRLEEIREKIDYIRHGMLFDPVLDEIYDDLTEILEELT